MSLSSKDELKKIYGIANDENKTLWEAAIHTAFPDGVPDSAEWSNIDTIIRVLSPFCAQDLNDTMLPQKGSMNFIEIAPSAEDGCIELRPQSEVAYICKPSRLQFQHIQRAPRESFFLLETHPLSPSGVYQSISSQSEELVELPDGTYVDTDCLDTGYIEDDETGAEIPTPDTYCYVIRFFAGKFLFVAKSSLWNRQPRTYDARHVGMSLSSIRSEIEAAL